MVYICKLTMFFFFTQLLNKAMRIIYFFYHRKFIAKKLCIRIYKLISKCKKGDYVFRKTANYASSFQYFSERRNLCGNCLQSLAVNRMGLSKTVFKYPYFSTVAGKMLYMQH